MTSLLTATASAQSFDLTPFAGNWKGSLYQLDMQLKLPLKLTVFKKAVKGGIAARGVIIVPGGSCNVDYVVTDVSDTTLFVTTKVTSGGCYNGDIQLPLSKNAAGKVLLGYTSYINASGETLTSPNLTGTMWRY